MKKSIFIFLVIFAIAAFACAAQKAGLYADSIEKALELSENDIDIATAALLVSKRWNPSINIEYYRNQIDEIARTVSARLNGQNPLYDGRKTTEIISKILFEEMGFKPVNNAENPEDLFLHTVLENKRGYCLSLSILYLAVAERLNLPVNGVVVPGHFFVRYTDHSKSFNIETTQQGANAPDKHYIKEFKIPQDGRRNIYLRNLSRRETIGCFFNNLANVYFDDGNIDNAYYYQQKAVDIAPLLAEARTNLGNIFLKKNMADMAVQQYIAAIEINPADAKTHHNLANAYAKKNMQDKAIEQYKTAMRYDPNFIEIYKGLSQAYNSQGQSDKAIEILKKAIDVNSRDADIYAMLGNIYQDRKNYSEAIANYRLALALKNDSPAATYGLGYAYFQSQMYYDAIEQFRATIFYEPSNAKAYFGLALAYNKLGWVEEETAAYQNAVKADPQMTAAWQNLAQIYMSQKQYEPAAAAYKYAADLSPSADVYYNIAVAYSSQKQYQQAEGYYFKALELSPDYPAAHNNLAITLYMLKKYEQALQHAKTAKQLGFDVSEDFIKELHKLTDANSVENKNQNLNGD
jgi:tetratricopeptide (TPR) repeat protein